MASTSPSMAYGHGLAVSLLGAAQMAMMTGYLGSSNVLESVLRSVHTRDPSRIDSHAGYYGQAMIYMCYTFSNLLTPTLRPILGSKRMLIIGSLLFTAYELSFLYLNSITFYICAAFTGVGYAVFYTGHGGYLSQHSSRQTLERHSALAQAFAYSSMVVGGIVLLAATALSGDLIAHDSVNQTEQAHGGKIYRDFSDNEIRYMFGAFAVASLAGNVIMGCLPAGRAADALAPPPGTAPPPFFASIGMMLRTMAMPRMLLLSVFFFSLGVYNAFILGVFPTTFTFNKALSPYRYLPAMSLTLFGLGDVLMGLGLSFLSKRVKHIGSIFAVLFGTSLWVVLYALIWLSTPEWATVHPTDEPSPFIQPTPLFVLLLSFVLGIADACVMTSRTVIAAVALPDRRDQSFAISKFYQSLSTAIFFFASPKMPMTTYIIMLLSGALIGCLAYLHVAVSVIRRERAARKNIAPLS